MKKNRIIFLMCLIFIRNTIHTMDVQPSPSQVQEVALRYRAQRDKVLQLGQERSDEEKEKIFDSFISETRNELQVYSKQVTESDCWSLAYASFSIMSGIAALIEGCYGSSCSEVGTCCICGASILAALCAYTGFCDVCLARNLKSINKKRLDNYLEVKKIKPIEVRVQLHHE